MGTIDASGGSNKTDRRDFFARLSGWAMAAAAFAASWLAWAASWLARFWALRPRMAPPAAPSSIAAPQIPRARPAVVIT